MARSRNQNVILNYVDFVKNAQVRLLELSGSGGISVDDEGAPVTGGPHTVLNFVGAGVVATDAGSGEATITIAGGAGGTILVEDEGSTVSGGPFDTLDFVGGGVTVTGAGAQATITVPSASSGGATLTGEWRFDSSTSTGPATGRFRQDDAVYANVTELFARTPDA